ncbi:MAG TPA: DUF1269 domain-containing protein [Ilumatobacter sp.]|nr:DUF1269 domain-containing protein [Ilumatobacter sp.]
MAFGNSDDRSPQVLVGISFADQFRAQEFMTAIARLRSHESFKLHDAVIVRKNAEGGTKVVETTDPSPARAATSGALWSALLGSLIAGPIGFVAGGVLGASTGAVTAKIVDIGVPDEWVGWFREAVATDTTTVVLLLSDVRIDDLVEEAKRFAGAHLIYSNLDATSFERIANALGDSAATQDFNDTHTEPVDTDPVDTDPVDSDPVDRP